MTSFGPYNVSQVRKWMRIIRFVLIRLDHPEAFHSRTAKLLGPSSVPCLQGLQLWDWQVQLWHNCERQLIVNVNQLWIIVTYCDELKVVETVIFRTSHAANLHCCTLCPTIICSERQLDRLGFAVWAKVSAPQAWYKYKCFMGRLKPRYTSLCSKQCVDWVSPWIGWLRMHCGETLNRLRRSYFLAGFVTLLSCHRLELTELESALKIDQSIETKWRRKRSTLSKFSVHNKKCNKCNNKHCKMVC